MRLSELIFQGVFGADRPQRLRPDGSLARLSLPPGVTARQVHDLVVACLYPTQLTDGQRRRLQMGENTKLAAVLKIGDRVYRVIRRADPASVRLQRKTSGGYDDGASSAAEVEAALQQKLGLPPLPVFLPLHLWRFDPEDVTGTSVAVGAGGDDRIPELIEQYRMAQKIEEAEDEIKELRRRIEECKEQLGKGQKVEEKLERAREKLDEIALDDLSDEDLQFLDTKDDKLYEIDTELQRLQDQEHKELDRIQNLLPQPPYRSPYLWVGLGVAIAALSTSFALHETHRLIALLSIPGWAVAAFALFRYYHNRGRANLRKVRLTSIRRRINQVREQQIEIRERVDHMLFKAGAEKEGELRARIPEAQRLQKGISKLEMKLEDVRQDSSYRRARKQLEKLQGRLETLRQRREELPELTLNSFQLERDLEELGVDTDEIDLSEDDQQGDWNFDSPFTWLRDVAEHTGQWNGTGLSDGARATWSKICGHVLSERFNALDLSAEGQLQAEALTDEQLELWQNTRTAEVQAVVSALALALHINKAAAGNSRALTSVWIAPPAEAMTSGHATKFQSVFKSAAKKSQIVICESAR